jgi:hypothetical protein
MPKTHFMRNMWYEGSLTYGQSHLPGFEQLLHVSNMGERTKASGGICLLCLVECIKVDSESHHKQDISILKTFLETWSMEGVM